MPAASPSQSPLSPSQSLSVRPQYPFCPSQSLSVPLSPSSPRSSPFEVPLSPSQSPFSPFRFLSVPLSPPAALTPCHPSQVPTQSLYSESPISLKSVPQSRSAPSTRLNPIFLHLPLSPL
nr:merozoite surface protein CMZ-8-like [Penaeus vannamei]